jgi:propionyl-CoA synthetase
MHPQDAAFQASIRDPEAFWSRQAEQVHWHKRPERALKRYERRLKSGARHAAWEWFPGGEISTTWNCVDRHVLSGM